MGEESKPRKQKQDRGGGSGSNSSGAAGAGGSGGGDSSVKSPPGKKRKGGGGWRGEDSGEGRNELFRSAVHACAYGWSTGSLAVTMLHA